MARLTTVVVGASLLCAAAPGTVTPRSGVAFAAAGDAVPAGAQVSDPPGGDVAPAPDQPSPAPDPNGATAQRSDPAPQPAEAAPNTTPTTGAPAAAPQSGPSGGPAAFWPVEPQRGPSSSPGPPVDSSRASNATACLQVRTAPSCVPPPRDTNGRRGDITASAATQPAVEPQTAQAPPTAALTALPPTRIPNLFIDKFRIPAFLLSIYQAAGIQYGIRWEVLAAINEIETDYGRNLNVSSAGAMGWMQFIPSSWKTWAVDANSDGKKDPYNPVDAIFAAARYLKAADADQDLRKAIYAYNHADWYVDSVLMRARFIGGIPEDLISALTGLSQGRLPVAGRARYGSQLAGQAPRGIEVFAAPGAPAVAVQDGEIVRVGHSKRLGRFVMLRDVYGNTYTYGRLKSVAQQVPVPKQTRQSATSIAKELALPAPDPVPTAPASAGSNTRPHGPASGGPPNPGAAAGAAGPPVRQSGPAQPSARQSGPAQPSVRQSALARPAARRPAPARPAARRSAPAQPAAKERLFAHPGRPASLRAGGRTQILESWAPLPGSASLRSYLTGSYGLKRGNVVLKRLVPGRKVIAGTILGRIGTNPSGSSPHMRFEIRPAGRGAPHVDPAPIVRGWRLLDSTAIDRARGGSTLANGPTLGQILLMGKDALAQRVLANPGIDIYACGRRDIQAGIVDRRVLATLELLAASGLKPTVTSLHCGHGFYTARGTVSAHSSGAAVDIAKVNGIPILGHQGPGSITDQTIRRLLSLQGALEPAQIISLMSYAGAANTLALPDHADHIHVGFRAQLHPLAGDGRLAPGALRPSQWTRLIDRLGAIAEPTVRLRPSPRAIRVVRPAVPRRRGP